MNGLMSVNNTQVAKQHNYANLASINEAIKYAGDKLLSQQNETGYWLYELESDCFFPTEYVFMMHYMGEVDDVLQHKIANYIRRQQADDGSFTFFPGGPSDLTLTTRAYFALKLAGDAINAPHMVIARNYILSQGGAAKCNILTRFLLATFEQIPWSGVPFVPVELILLPKWFPINIYKMAYWARTILVPLSIMRALKAKAENPKQLGIQELFLAPREKEQKYLKDGPGLKKFFSLIDKLGQILEPIIPKSIRNTAIKKAHVWINDRLNGKHGLAGIIPAMNYAYEAMDSLGVDRNSQFMQDAKAAIKRQLIINRHEAYCQCAVSPVWDTSFALLALLETQNGKLSTATQKAASWLASKQLTDEPGDWRESRPNYRGGGGWAFQFNSPNYPDIDDSAITALAILQTRLPEFESTISQAARWLKVMQSKNGGYGAYDIDNEYSYINMSTVGDYITLIDPPSSDITARVVAFLANIVKQRPEYQNVLDDAIDYLWREQENNGSWYGRWGCNYIYGTWSVLFAMEQANINQSHPRIKQAVIWLKNSQAIDGGWGESCMTYHEHDFHKQKHQHPSTSFQTAWALLGLMSAGEVESPEVQRGIQFLISKQQPNGIWEDSSFSAPGFPGALYLKYHGYSIYFPLWALARYRNLTNISKI